ncbi:chorismate synthase [Pseudobdellovibrio exovorus]|uniref:Chorismate synthase n=1 Tax=Pseudobdellovibrio exovorus JSS TaxID=1184267 RepID=M4V675_9BACT|nr:chorismate synthase [Pseudobdellovibrio exovorus]AGH94698.1 chorismate synthase [Pseudobdellovibrio exovorus JSS]
MSANSFGQIFKMISFGESHGVALGVVIEGCPAGVVFDQDLLVRNMQRRRPGQSSVTTARNEADAPEVVSGVFDGKTLGTPICILVRNADQRSQDYESIQHSPRIGHADDTWKTKFQHVDHRGGGRSSGRETLARVLAGSVAQMLCQQLLPQLQVKSFSSQIAHLQLTENAEQIWKVNVDEYITRLPHEKLNNEAVQLLESAKVAGESYGGTVRTFVKNVPAGLGQPVFHKFKSDLASAMLSIGATTSFEFGAGHEAVRSKGTEFHQDLQSAVYGGIRGGLTTGEPLDFSVGFKPTSSIKDTAKKGRHDPCIVPRAVPVVEAMTWLVLADHVLWSRLDRIR